MLAFEQAGPGVLRIQDIRFLLKLMNLDACKLFFIFVSLFPRPLAQINNNSLSNNIE